IAADEQTMTLQRSLQSATVRLKILNEGSSSHKAAAAHRGHIERELNDHKESLRPQLRQQLAERARSVQRQALAESQRELQRLQKRVEVLRDQITQIQKQE